VFVACARRRGPPAPLQLLDREFGARLRDLSASRGDVSREALLEWADVNAELGSGVTAASPAAIVPPRGDEGLGRRWRRMWMDARERHPGRSPDSAYGTPWPLSWWSRGRLHVSGMSGSVLHLAAAFDKADLVRVLCSKGDPNVRTGAAQVGRVYVPQPGSTSGTPPPLPLPRLHAGRTGSSSRGARCPTGERPTVARRRHGPARGRLGLSVARGQGRSLRQPARRQRAQPLGGFVAQRDRMAKRALEPVGLVEAPALVLFTLEPAWRPRAHACGTFRSLREPGPDPARRRGGYYISDTAYDPFASRSCAPSCRQRSLLTVVSSAGGSRAGSSRNEPLMLSVEPATAFRATRGHRGP